MSNAQPASVSAISGIIVKPMTNALGAEVLNVDLTRELDLDAVRVLKELFLQYKVLFFRDQNLTPEQHIAFAMHFGDEVQKPGFVPLLDGYPQIRRQEMNEYSSVSSDINWHTDDTFLEVPSKCSVLHALEVPIGKGDTVWVNMAAAYEGLSKPMQDFLLGLTAIHDLVETMGPGVLKQYGPDRWQKFRESTPSVEHPIIRTHPETKEKCLFVNPLMTFRIKGLSDPESKAILDMLYEHMTKEEYMVRFRWEKHSVAFWDNRCTAHRGINDFFPAHRLMHRVAIADTKRPV
ncbi:MAG: taurine dioxygenase [Chromatiales bacterium]|jgi:taurine dioxygenase|nr:taurine dioxygenase [Chromatiales bacterium]